jgi:hypothetical protein
MKKVVLLAAVALFLLSGVLLDNNSSRLFSESRTRNYKAKDMIVCAENTEQAQWVALRTSNKRYLEIAGFCNCIAIGSDLKDKVDKNIICGKEQAEQQAKAAAEQPAKPEEQSKASLAKKEIVDGYPLYIYSCLCMGKSRL